VAVVKARVFVGVLWLASMAISAALTIVVLDFDPATTAIWAGATVLVPASVLCVWALGKVGQALRGARRRRPFADTEVVVAAPVAGPSPTEAPLVADPVPPAADGVGVPALTATMAADGPREHEWPRVAILAAAGMAVAGLLTPRRPRR
jgi:hypothetical protein